MPQSVHYKSWSYRATYKQNMTTMPQSQLPHKLEQPIQFIKMLPLVAREIERENDASWRFIRVLALT